MGWRAGAIMAQKKGKKKSHKGEHRHKENFDGQKRRIEDSRILKKTRRHKVPN